MKNLLKIVKTDKIRGISKTKNVMVQLCPFNFQVIDLSTGATLVNSKAKDGVYEWPVITSSPILAFACSKSTSYEWHSRLGHPSSSILNQVVSQFSLPSSTKSNSFICSSCAINKSHKIPFSNSTVKSRGPLDIVFTDVWTSPVHSVDGYKYYVIFADHYTRYIWFYPIKHKFHVATIFLAFKAFVDSRFKTKLTTLYSDNGGQYIALVVFLSPQGIAHHTTPPHNPEHNGIT